MRTKKKWCGFHQKMEPVEGFALNAFKESGLQDHCREAQNYYVVDYRERNKELCNKKSAIYVKYGRGLLTEEQKNRAVKKLNREYGIATRIA